ncbi:hypothetical protein, partial [Methylobacterium sp. 10]|uniref:hypothetical protein n=1 Tax=Methylobacterium sp. 10 TaxID=1101191 RepID=UPI001AEBCD27
MERLSGGGRLSHPNHPVNPGNPAKPDHTTINTRQQKQTITQLTSRIIHPIIIQKTQQPPAEPKSPLAAADEQ